MRNLVDCPCGHSLEKHASAGCSGCGCGHDLPGALDAAIDAVVASSEEREVSLSWSAIRKSQGTH